MIDGKRASTSVSNSYTMATSYPRLTACVQLICSRVLVLYQLSLFRRPFLSGFYLRFSQVYLSCPQTQGLLMKSQRSAVPVPLPWVSITLSGYVMHISGEVHGIRFLASVTLETLNHLPRSYCLTGYFAFLQTF